jgi:pimeloyl-ACP methyl ester carboxylesterase
MAPVAGGSPARSVVLRLASLVIVLGLLGCDTGSGRSQPATSWPASQTPVPPQRSDGFEGSFDVGGHDLFLRCEGTGSPTVVHLHGLGGTHRNASAIFDEIAEDTRFCSYDRRNMGNSDKPLGRQTASDSVEDLHALLAAAELERPFLLVGASFGGLIATMYAATYPSEVTGLVILDGTLPTLDRLLHVLRPGQRRSQLMDLRSNPERIDVAASLAQARRLLSAVPAVPTTYLAARPVALPRSWPRQRMVATIEKLTRSFVDAFPQGRVVRVRSPHYMELAVPHVIVEEVTRVIDR